MTQRNNVNADLVKGYKWSFTDVIANNVDTSMATIVQLGTGMTVNQSGGNLLITTGTTAYAETIIRSVEPFDVEGIFRYGLTLSQRIVNNNFAIEFVDLFGDNLYINITSATAATVTKPNHNLSARDIGKGVWIGAITAPSTLAQRVTIASITDANNFVITGAGMTVGVGLCSMFGFNYHQIIYSGITATVLGTGYETQRKGWRNTAANATINTTATGHIGVIESVRFNESTYSDAPFGSGAVQQFLTRATMNQNVPDGVELYLQIRAFNGTVAPATTTTMTMAFIDAQIFNTAPVNIASMEAISGKTALPVTIQTNNAATVAQSVGGPVAHTGVATGNPVRIGGRVNTAADITLIAGDVSDVFMTTAGQAVQKPFATAELDWYYVAAASGIVNTTTAVTVKAAAGASIRNYITGLQIMTDTLGAATEFAIRDGAAGAVLWRGKLNTTALPAMNIDFPTPIKGTANTLLEVVTLTAVTGGVYVNIQGYTSF